MKIENSGKKELEWSGVKLKEMNLEELEKLQGVIRNTKNKKEEEFLNLQQKIHYLSLIKSECKNLITLKKEIKEIQETSKKLTQNVKIKTV